MLTDRGPLGLKDKTPKKDRAHMAKVASLPCVICGYWPVEVHHCIHDRFSQEKAPDRDTIPLCKRCHDSLHADKTAWRNANGPDWGYLPRVRRMLKDVEENTI